MTTSTLASPLGTCRRFSYLLVSLALFASCHASAFDASETVGSTVIVESQEDLVRALFPDRVETCVSNLAEGLTMTSRLNPYYLRGDFDGDQTPDHAFLVERAGTQGIAVCLGSKTSPIVLGAGQVFHDMESLDFDHWAVFDQGPVVRGVGEDTVPTLKGDALYLLWSETASALLYLEGDSFHWYQQGD